MKKLLKELLIAAVLFAIVSGLYFTQSDIPGISAPLIMSADSVPIGIFTIRRQK